MSFKYNNSVDKTNGNQLSDKTNDTQIMSNTNLNHKSNDNSEILEASKVLHLALQQMDGIIASEYQLFCCHFLSDPNHCLRH